MATKSQKDYSQGKVYKIEPTCDHEEGDIYIGATTKQYLSQRMSAHRRTYKMWKARNIHYMTSFILFEKFGVDCCNIILLENTNATNYVELASREAHYIKSLKCVNHVIPLRTDQEYREATKDNLRKY